MKTKISPTLIVRSLPITHWTCLAIVTAMGIFHIAVILLHAFNEALFEQWLRFAKPAVDVMSRYVLAIDKISHFMLSVGYSYRVDIVRNSIAIDWIVFAVGLPIVLISCLCDFFIKGRTISDFIYGRVNAAIKGKRLYSTVVIFYFGFFVVSFLVVFTDRFYSQFGLYESDITLSFSIFFFYAALVCPAAALALCVTRVWETVHHLVNRPTLPGRRHEKRN